MLASFDAVSMLTFSQPIPLCCLKLIPVLRGGSSDFPIHNIHKSNFTECINLLIA
jgi:hypothetical protein